MTNKLPSLPASRFAKLFRLAGATALSVCLAGASFAQVNFTIGTGTSTNGSTGNPTPYNDYYEGDRQQFLYLASELTAAGMTKGNIIAIKWDVASTNSSNPQGWSMYIGTTTATSLSSVFQPQPSYQVYGPASTSFMPSAGVNNYNLAVPFYWDGTSNILIQTCHGVGSGCRGYTTNASVRYTSVSFNGSTYYNTDCAGSLCGQTSGTASTARPNVILTWLPACPGKVLASPDNVSLCETDSTTFSSTIDSVDTYRWQLNTGPGWVNLSDGVNYSGTTTTKLTVKNTLMAMNNYQYRLVGTNTPKACSVESNAGKLTMVPSSASSIVVSVAPDTMICKNQEVVFQTSFTNGGTTPQYRWLRNDTMIQGEVNASLKLASLKDGDQIKCRFISSAQCVFPKNSDPVTFAVADALVPAVSLKVTNNGDGSHTFSATALNGGANAKYYWFVNGKMQTAVSGPDFTTSDLKPWDKVTVGLYSSLDCAEPKYVTSGQKTTGVAELADGTTALFPNPNKGDFTLTAADIHAANVNVVISNTLGQVVYNTQVQVENGNVNHRIQLASVPAGVYVLQIDADGYTKQLKFTIAE